MKQKSAEWNYVAVIGDIIESRKIENRQAVQLKLQSVLDVVNKKYEKSLASKFMITLGDELQGLVRDKRTSVDIISFIVLEMLPICLRFGVGVGEISTDIVYDNSVKIDGSAYHRARKNETGFGFTLTCRRAESTMDTLLINRRIVCPNTLRSVK